MGKSGSGKSVMIKCLAGLMQPDSGSIQIMGKNLLGLNQKDLDERLKNLVFYFKEVPCTIL